VGATSSYAWSGSRAWGMADSAGELAAAENPGTTDLIMLWYKPGACE